MPTFIMAVEAVGRDELKLAMGTPPEGLITQIAMPRLTPDGQFPAPKDRRGFGVVAAIGLGLIAGAVWLWFDTRGPARRQAAATTTPAAAVAPAAALPRPARAVAPAGEPAAASAEAAASPSDSPAVKAPAGAASEAKVVPAPPAIDAKPAPAARFVASRGRFGAVERPGAGEAVHEGFRAGRAVAAVAPARQGLNPVESKTASW